MKDHEDEKIINANLLRPHLFILGAGATVATIPHGDRNGKKSAVMNNFLSEIGHEDIIKGVKIKTQSKNIEAIYSELVERPECTTYVTTIEKLIYNYFSQLELPEEPTLYDYLILSLRSKDCIATFNWDPLLVQAYQRVKSITCDLPQLIFLHGNVSIGLCKDCHTFSPLIFKSCPKCHSALEAMPLLYPVKNKSYTRHWGIEDFWKALEYYLESAAVVTIWGYSAPKSDVKAVEMMLKAFSSSFRKLDQIEVIDIAEPNEISEKWKSFSKETSFHINIIQSLEDSLLWEFPRRSIEGYTKRYITGWWNSSNLTLKRNLSWSEMEDLMLPLLEQEKNKRIAVI